ncbi:Alpha/beta hydrolase fold protein [Candidatus Promineifilum breve]|uniref:Alpha/beta hydrolase fold protein n=1 Tax=Candidatus Promineifilum breve TaxID=1806508 RepID=A0A170PGX4_9CHLR|nr:alpha/beta hydrolase [Candidatus Promineifilum breve]CUS04003.2 Alpha/beta hydrolase fold protein [Candidatus Promineifilum breve]
MQMQSYVLTSAGSSTHYWLSGPEGAPLVVLTHGATIDHHEWDATVTILAGHYRVLTWDVPGHGLSRPADFSVAGAVERLVAILDTVDARQAAFVGHSLGGNLHQELVFHHPERVRCMVCVDCTWNFQKLTRWESLLVKSARPILKFYPHDMLVNQSLAATTSSAAAQEPLHSAMNKLSKDEFIQIMMAATDCLHYEPGYRINKPLLLILGDLDRTGNIRKAMPLWAKEEPLARLVIVPDTKHAPNLDAAEVFHGELMGFLEIQLG